MIRESSQSPDINPIEVLGCYLRPAAHASEILNRTYLKEFCTEERNKPMTETDCQFLETSN